MAAIPQNWSLVAEELKKMWIKRDRENMTKHYETYINTFVDEVFEARSGRMYEQFKELVTTAKSKTDLRIMLWEYSYTDVYDKNNLYKSYTDELGITHCYLADYLQEQGYETEVTGTWVKVHELVRKTNVLKILAAKFGADKFRVVKQMGNNIDANETFAVRRVQLWLEFFPFGVPKELQ